MRTIVATKQLHHAISVFSFILFTKKIVQKAPDRNDIFFIFCLGLNATWAMSFIPNF
jgi:hypothetical protein